MQGKHYLCVLGPMLVLGTALLLGCAAASPPEAGAPLVSPPGKATARPEGKPQGVLRTSLAANPPHLDPARVTDLMSGEVVKNVYSRLVKYDAKGNIISELAKDWALSSDGKSYVFKLRDDVNFHDGTKLEAKHVKYSLDRLSRPETNAGNAELILGGVEGFKDVFSGKVKELSGIKVIDPLNISITLNSTSSPSALLHSLTMHAASIVLQSAIESGGERWFETKPIGTGPFRLKKWDHNSKILLEANTDYFAGSPNVARVELSIVPGSSTAVAMYENDELDLVEVPFEDLDRVRNDATLSKQLVDFPRLQTVMFAVNPKLYAPAADHRVRQAIASAIDRETMVKNIYKGTARVAGGMVPPGIPTHDKASIGYPYDPKKAKQLLLEAGFADGKGLPPLEIYPNPRTSEFVQMGEMIAAMLKQNLGIDAGIKHLEFAKWLSDANKRSLPAFVQGWTAETTDPNYFLQLVLQSKSGRNRAAYESAEYDKLLQQANEVKNPDEAIKLYAQADAMAIKDAVYIPVSYTRYIHLIKPYIKDLELVPIHLGRAEFLSVKVQK